MGMPAQDHEPRRNNHEKTQMATDEMVYQPYHLPLCLVNRNATGHGTLQETDAKVIALTRVLCV